MVTIAAVVIFLGGQLGSLAHNAFVEHEVCAEHGELVHAEEHPDGATADQSDSQRAAIDDSVYAPAPSPVEDEHDHCTLCSLAREKAQRASHSATVAHAPDVGSVALEAPDTAIRVAVIHRVAPKQSPPA